MTEWELGGESERITPTACASIDVRELARAAKLLGVFEAAAAKMTEGGAEGSLHGHCVKGALNKTASAKNAGR